MRHERFFLILVLFLTACQASFRDLPSSGVKLMPYETQAIIAVDDQPQTADTKPTAEPQPTPTPFVHLIMLGDTISSIALKYGVTIDAIITANPEAIPTALIVGDEILIPAASISQGTHSDPSLSKNMLLSEPNCARMGNGLWCAVMVENLGQDDLENVIVTFSFLDADGAILKEISTPAVMRLIQSSESVPAVVYMDIIPSGYQDIVMKIFSVSKSIEDTSPYLPVTIINEQLVIEELAATVSGQMRVDALGVKDRADISVCAAAFDADGKVVGVRRLDSAVAADETFNFSITVYSAFIEIEDVALFSEAY